MLNSIMTGDSVTIIGTLVALVILMTVALPFHEFSHALVAYWLGDDTAKRCGRLTLNPVSHFNIMGTMFLLFFGYGWAEPVPVNYNNLKYRKYGVGLVSLAGPMSNLILATIGTLIQKIFFYFGNGTSVAIVSIIVLGIFVQINITIGAFNLIPIPPLDGSKIIAIFLTNKAFYKYEDFVFRNQRNIFYAMVGIFFILPMIGGPFSAISQIIYLPLAWLQKLLYGIANYATIYIDYFAGAV